MIENRDCPASNTLPPTSGHSAFRPTWLRQVRGQMNVIGNRGSMTDWTALRSFA